jgi:tetratricopeptide (TPR) repeat protein
VRLLGFTDRIRIHYYSSKVERRKGGEIEATKRARNLSAGELMTRRLSFIAAILGVVGAVGLAGCELFVAGGGAIYGAFHGADPLTTAYVSLRRHDCAAAESEFSAFLDKEPNDARAISGRADALVCLEKYDAAIADYSRAIELDPKWFDYLGRGVAYKAKGDQCQAIRNFDEGIAIGSKVPALYVYKGAALSARGDASGAQAEFEKVSSLISNKPEAFNKYGWALATSPIGAYRDGPAAIQLRASRLRTDFMESRKRTGYFGGGLRRSRAIR